MVDSYDLHIIFSSIILRLTYCKDYLSSLHGSTRTSALEKLVIVVLWFQYFCLLMFSLEGIRILALADDGFSLLEKMKNNIKSWFQACI